MIYEPPLVDGKPCENCTPRDGCSLHPPNRQLGTGSGSTCIFTNDSKERFLAAKRLGASDTKACAAAGWSQEILYKWRRDYRKGLPHFPSLVRFLTLEVPDAERVLYEKALHAIERGLEQADEDKAANVGLKVLDKLYGKDLDPVGTKIHHVGEEGGPIEFRIVFDGANPALPNTTGHADVIDAETVPPAPEPEDADDHAS